MPLGSRNTAIAKGSFVVGLKKNSNPWGGPAVQCVAGDGIEVDSLGFTPAVTHIQNEASYGNITRRAGVKGNEKHAGDIVAPFYYRGCEVPLALVFGQAGVPTTLAEGAYQHDLRLARDHKGLHATMLEDPFGDGAGGRLIHGWPHVKFTKMSLEVAEDGMAKLTFSAVPFALNFNHGKADPTTIVTDVQVADGALTIASQPTKCRKLHIRVTDGDTSITEYIVTIVGTDADGNAQTEVYTLSSDGLVHTTTATFDTVTTITASGLAVTYAGDTIEITTTPIVDLVEPADGAQTIVEQPTNPSPLNVTIVDGDTSITEYILTIVGDDRDGKQITEVYTLSTDGLTWTSENYFASVTSITASGLAGTATGDTLLIGATNGVNNRSTVDAITTPAERDEVVFAHLDELLINDQDGAALVAATATQDKDEVYVSKFRVEIDLAPSDTVSTKFGYRVDEPTSGGAGFAQVSGGLSFSKYDTRNHAHLKDQLSKARKKMKVVLTGPQIAATGYANSLTLYFNDVQFASGAPSLGGAGVRPFDLDYQAHEVATIPTGFPAGYVDAIQAELVSSLATDPLA
jgi:hypothetical protein